MLFFLVYIFCKSGIISISVLICVTDGTSTPKTTIKTFKAKAAKINNLCYPSLALKINDTIKNCV